MMQHMATDLTVTVGFGAPLVDSLKPKERPKALRPMPKFKGDQFDPHQTQADLALQICSNVKYANHVVSKALMQVLHGVVVPSSHHHSCVAILPCANNCTETAVTRLT
jgi:deferrochelatase/peroxidase EfeB